MSKKIEPADVVVQFFQEGPPEAVRVLFPIVKGIVERRALFTTKKKAKGPRALGADVPREKSAS